jgi:hypothetical protein
VRVAKSDQYAVGTVRVIAPAGSHQQYRLGHPRLAAAFEDQVGDRRGIDTHLIAHVVVVAKDSDFSHEPWRPHQQSSRRDLLSLNDCDRIAAVSFDNRHVGVAAQTGSRGDRNLARTGFEE